MNPERLPYRACDRFPPERYRENIDVLMIEAGKSAKIRLRRAS